MRLFLSLALLFLSFTMLAMPVKAGGLCAVDLVLGTATDVQALPGVVATVEGAASSAASNEQWYANGLIGSISTDAFVSGTTGNAGQYASNLPSYGFFVATNAFVVNQVGTTLPFFSSHFLASGVFVEQTDTNVRSTEPIVTGSVLSYASGPPSRAVGFATCTLS